MSKNKPMSADSTALAERALAQLGANAAAHEVMSIQCSRAHHLASVFETGDGFVVRSRVGPHAHGRKDRADEAHHDSESGTTIAAILAPEDTDVSILAWCDCGQHALAASEVGHALKAGLRTMHVR